MAEPHPWAAIPPGRYAVPVKDEAGQLVGWAIWERIHRPARDRLGRGRDEFRLNGVEPVGDVEPHDWQARRVVYDAIGSAGYAYEQQAAAAHQILADLAAGDTYRGQAGKLTGRCGVCGRALTDPVSVGRGIGPECYSQTRSNKETANRG